METRRSSSPVLVLIARGAERRRLLVEVLENEGFAVAAVDTASDALRVFESVTADGVIALDAGVDTKSLCEAASRAVHLVVPRGPSQTDDQEIAHVVAMVRAVMPRRSTHDEHDGG